MIKKTFSGKTIFKIVRIVSGYIDFINVDTYDLVYGIKTFYYHTNKFNTLVNNLVTVVIYGAWCLE
jgi:hypothetical protein